MKPARKNPMVIAFQRIVQSSRKFCATSHQESLGVRRRRSVS
jgi:hypothetical protein